MNKPTLTELIDQNNLANGSYIAMYSYTGHIAEN